jgi:transposase
MREMLNEKQWRRYLALEAQECGSVMQVAHEAGVSHNTIRRGVRELEAGEPYRFGERQGQIGGGRKPCMEKEANLVADLESQLDPKGDPMSWLKWTTQSVVHLKEGLEQLGHQVSETTIRRL